MEYPHDSISNERVLIIRDRVDRRYLVHDVDEREYKLEENEECFRMDRSYTILNGLYS